ncbi:MAG: class I fructose-bisphosphate aldolase [Patescibacteria group bacterium]
MSNTAQTETLRKIAKLLVAPKKGILASDESTKSINKKFAEFGIEQSAEMHRQYREIFIGTENLGEYVSGVIMYDETLRQRDSKNTPFTKILMDKGVLPGIKVDKGLADLPNFEGEKVTEGLDGLGERLKEYYELGARFTKWRCLMSIDTSKNLPSDACILANAHTLARYAAIVQQNGMVPIVEPEVLYKGDHSRLKAEEVTTKVLLATFEQLMRYKVDLQAIILKTSMVLAGKECPAQSTPAEVATATIRTFKTAVPDYVPGIVFLSGGQDEEQATVNLGAIVEEGKKQGVKWALTFSFLRALEQPSLEIWQGSAENVTKAREVFVQELKANKAVL